jgi:uncharacterized protein (TIGR02996 family)
MTTTHDTRAHLLAAVRAHPDEDTPRLVYADWLQEYGDDDDRARAEFIRVQVAESHTQTWYNGATGLATRADELLRRYGHEWLGPYYGAANGRSWTFRRGFVERVTCSGDDWCAHADAILASHPVRAVTLTSWPDLPHAMRRASGGMPVYVFEVAGEEIEMPLSEISSRQFDAVQDSLRLLRKRWDGVTFHPPRM